MSDKDHQVVTSQPFPISPESSPIAMVPDFAAAAKSVLRYLHEKLGFDLWMVTRTEGNDWIVLQTEDHGYGVEPRAVFKWADSFCSRMVLGNGPRLAPRSDDVPEYAAAEIGRQVRIGAYLGVPLAWSDGSLFGTLCAIHPTPKMELKPSDLPLVELLAEMLSGLLNAELKTAETQRLAERAMREAEMDELTGLYNRRAWNRLLETEEHRCRRYGNSASIIQIDLDGLKEVNDTLGHAAGDALIERAARALAGAVRESDIAARLGGDEFAVLCVECDGGRAEALTRRIEEEMKSAGVAGSLGRATRIPAMGLFHAADEADRAMYENKTRRKSRTATSGR